MAKRAPIKKVIKLDYLSSPYHITYKKNGHDCIIKRYEVEVNFIEFRDAPMEIRSHVFVVIWDSDNISVFRVSLKVFDDRKSLIDALTVGSTYAIEHMYAASFF